MRRSPPKLAIVFSSSRFCSAKPWFDEAGMRPNGLCALPFAELDVAFVPAVATGEANTV
jgi:hypothetical protein